MDKYAPLTPKEISSPISAPPLDDDAVFVTPIPDDAPAAPEQHRRFGEASATWEYCDASGETLLYVHRFDPPGARKQFFPQTLWRDSSGKLTWKWKAPPAPRPLYGLERLAKKASTADVLIVEGEKSTDAADRLFHEYAVVSSFGGSAAPDKADWSPLAGRNVTIWPDLDAAGDKYAGTVAVLLRDLGCDVEIVDAHTVACTAPDGSARELPNPGWDAADAFDEWVMRADTLGERGVAMDSLRELVAANAKPFVERAGDDPMTPMSPMPIGRPRILVDPVNPDVTVDQLRDVFADTGEFFDRGAPVRVVYDKAQGGAVAVKMDADAIVLTAHKLARPYALKAKDASTSEVDARLPKSIASMYLADIGNWQLNLLNGIASAPLLGDDGSIRSAKGYDEASGFWLENVPDVDGLIVANPSLQDAAAALRLIRIAFRTFCFADAETCEGPDGIEIVDVDAAPDVDESTFLTALLTAVCRPSLPLAPGALFTAAETSGAGTGKGKLARCISAIAFGRQPAAVTAGAGVEELEKRLAAKLIESAPAILVDNVNGAALKSYLLASAISERPAEIRILGRTEMAKLNASAFLIITGNGLRVSEDLARRFIEVRFDARTEDPESRPFHGDIVSDMTARRAELLAACVTIWRWGRQNNLPSGKALGGFDAWSRWCRDPLIALGCRDAVERVSEAKANDPRRQRTAEIFASWWNAHSDSVVAVKDLDRSVLDVIDPQERGRQYVARVVVGLAGTRLAGFIMTKQESAGKWNGATYRLQNSGAAASHRTHRTHRTAENPISPMSPMPSSQPRKSASENRTEEGPISPMSPMPSARQEISGDDDGIPKFLRPKSEEVGGEL